MSSGLAAQVLAGPSGSNVECPLLAPDPDKRYFATKRKSSFPGKEPVNTFDDQLATVASVR